MATLSKKRQQALTADAETIRKLYAEACARWGDERVIKDLSLLWTLRCMHGMQGVLPFEATQSKTLSEVLWVAREVCGLPAQA